jgi:hypothetical protein
LTLNIFFWALESDSLEEGLEEDGLNGEEGGGGLKGEEDEDPGLEDEGS